MKCYIKYFVLLFTLNFIEGAFRCDYKYSALAKTWFKTFVVPATWSDARLRCALEGAVLASPTTLEIKAEMTNMMNDFTTAKEIFTGIHATLSRGDYQTVEGKPLSKFHVTWAVNEPDNKGNNENCLTLNGNGDLADQSCDVPRPYICYRTGDPQVTVNECGIDPGYYLDTRTGSCYKFHMEPRNFSRASSACVAEGGHLAIINSNVESTVLKEMFDKVPKNKMYGMVETWKNSAHIGYFDWGEHGEWRTIHGETLDEAGFSQFNAGEPYSPPYFEYCGAVWRNGLLNDVPCSAGLVFICERSPEDPGVCHVNEAMVQNNAVW